MFIELILSYNTYNHYNFKFFISWSNFVEVDASLEPLESLESLESLEFLQSFESLEILEFLEFLSAWAESLLNGAQWSRRENMGTRAATLMSSATVAHSAYLDDDVIEDGRRDNEMVKLRE